MTDLFQRNDLCLYYLFNHAALRRELVTHNAGWCHCQAGQFAEAYHLIRHEQLFLYLHRWGGNNLLLDLYQHLLPPEKWGADPLVSGQIYREMGTIQNTLGQKHEARLNYERALAFLRQTRQPPLIAEVLNDLGTVQRALKQEQLAEACYQEAWSLCEQAGKHFAQRGITLNNKGRLLYEQGQHKQQHRQKEQAQACYLEALACYEQALAAHRSNNQPEEEGWTLLNLGDVYTVLDQRNTAHDYYQQALKQFRDLGERRGEGTVLNNLGVLLAYDSTGKEQAATCYIQALRIFRAVGDRWQERKTLRNLGRWLMIHVPTQDPARSQAYLQGVACFLAAKDVLEERRNPHTETIPGWLLASLRQDLGEEKMAELLKEGEARSWQIIEEFLNTSRDESNK
jgi:tetratricopeptide (TPR) repeat protein